MTDCSVILVSVGSREDGDRIAAALVGEHLAACVNIIGPMRSIYRWENEVRHDEEFLLVIKTPTARFEALAARIRALHSYATPEIIAVPITAGSADYLEWVRGVTRAPG